ncbi:hypothetical protein NA78x_000771 [Anatilimnocola sp. NA78]|uniref:hypothetical protein n=1 Tax=Anatilimnocola sp. NA78 TaxID=3415683 RepID=UPI003CE571E8
MKMLSRLILCCACCLLAATAAAQNPKAPANKNPQPSPTPNNPGQVVPPGQFGQPFNPNGGGGNAAAMRETIMKKFDRDGDGKLNAQEQIAATRAMQERGIRTPGVPNLVGPGNNAGPQSGPGVGQAPAQAPAPKLNKREELLLKRFDKDGDGKLSAEEKAAARAELGQKNKAEKK